MKSYTIFATVTWQQLEWNNIKLHKKYIDLRESERENEKVTSDNQKQKLITCPRQQQQQH